MQPFLPKVAPPEVIRIDNPNEGEPQSQADKRANQQQDGSPSSGACNALVQSAATRLKPPPVKQVTRRAVQGRRPDRGVQRLSVGVSDVLQKRRLTAAA